MTSKLRHDVLLVEDNDADVFLLRTAIELEDLPLNLLSVQDGVEVLEFLDQHNPPELLLLDLNMPRMNGFEVLEHLQQDQPPPFPIVVFTTSQAAHDRERAEALGADAFIVKPQGFTEIASLLRRILERLKRQAPWDTLAAGS